MWRKSILWALASVCAVGTVAALSCIGAGVAAAPQSVLTARPASPSDLPFNVMSTGKSVIVGGVEGSKYDEVTDILVDQRGGHVAYKARRGKNWLVVKDGVEGKEYGYVFDLALSPDGQHVAYRESSGKLTWSFKPPVVIDGAEGRGYDWVDDRSIVFSADGKHVAYWTSGAHRGKWVLVVDGVEGKEVDYPYTHDRNEVVFSPDGKRIAYTTRQGDSKRIVVIDGVESPPYDEITTGTPVFSPDSKHVAYGARRGTEKWALVLDGTEGKLCRTIADHSVAFSPDSAHVAYAAGRTGAKTHTLVVDAAEGKEYDDIAFAMPVVRLGKPDLDLTIERGTLAPAFSPDGKRVAYAARRGKAVVVVVDAAESGPYEKVAPRTPVFSPDGRHAAWAASVGGQWRIFVDGAEVTGRTFDAFFTGDDGTLVFDAPNRFHALADVGKSGDRSAGGGASIIRSDVDLARFVIGKTSLLPISRIVRVEVQIGASEPAPTAGRQ